MKPELNLQSPKIERYHKRKSGLSWQAWLLLMILILSLAYVISPYIHTGGRRPHNRTKAVGHAKQVLIAITEFESEYGARPGQIHVDEGLIPGARADSANDCFRQTLQGLKTVRSEAIFYAPTRFTIQPDNDIGDESNLFAQACAKGEVGFIYIDAPTEKDGAPLMVAPLYDTRGRFDTELYNGKAVLLKTDGSVEALEIDPDTGRVHMLVDGKKVDIFSARNPLFRDPPMIKYPEPR